MTSQGLHMSNPDVTSFFDEETNTVSYIVTDPSTKKCAIIDSVLDYDASSGHTATASADELIKFVSDNKLSVEWILETHAHADHFSAAPYLQKMLGGTIAIGEHIPDVQHVFGSLFNETKTFKTDGSQFGHLFKDRETFLIGEIQAEVIFVPGHTPACIAYHIGNAVFVGDTLFMPDYGSARCDFPGGDAGTLYDSVQKLYALPDATRMFLCHDYKAPGRDTFEWETTVGLQKQHNIHLHKGVTREDFIKMRTARDKTLPMPKLILPSIQVNMRAGDLPEPENNGVRYLKIPLNSV
jgi:glyoxylase-like metal-dependent hydrolase (beta-lactamase superfamily II)